VLGGGADSAANQLAFANAAAPIVRTKIMAQTMIFRRPVASRGRGVSPGINLLSQAESVPGGADYV